MPVAEYNSNAIEQTQIGSGRGKLRIITYLLERWMRDEQPWAPPNHERCREWLHLEADSQAELNRARRVHLRSHNAEGGSAYLLVWRAESYVIERIKELRCELQVHTLCDVIALSDREVPVVHVIHANGVNVSGCVAEPHHAAGIYWLEARRVKPAIGCAGFTRA